MPDNNKTSLEDEEYARLLSRMEELEKEELEAENANEEDEDDDDIEHQLTQLAENQEMKNLEVCL